MVVNFKHGAVCYSLVVLPEGRREQERRVENIQPQASAKPTYLPTDEPKRRPRSKKPYRRAAA